MQRLTKDQIDKLREGFKAHPFFLDVKSTFDALHPLCGDSPCIMRYDAQLFHSASVLLDRIITHSSTITESLWTDLKADFQDIASFQSKDIDKEIAMLLYAVAYTVEVVPKLMHSNRLTKKLLELIRTHLGKDVETQFTSAMYEAARKHAQAVDKWLADYTSGETLTHQIEDVLKARKSNAEHAFHINASVYDRKVMIKEFTDGLFNKGFILQEDSEAVKNLFFGRTFYTKIHWQDDSVASLVHIIRRIRQIGIRDGAIVDDPQVEEWDEENRLVAIPANVGIWVHVVCYCFRNKNGECYAPSNLTKVHKLKKANSDYEELAKAFSSNYKLRSAQP